MRVWFCSANDKKNVSFHQYLSTNPLFSCIYRKLGASEGTINQEIQRYQQLESVAVNDIRRDVRKKLRRSSMRVNADTFLHATAGGLQLSSQAEAFFSNVC